MLRRLLEAAVHFQDGSLVDLGQQAVLRAIDEYWQNISAIDNPSASAWYRTRRPGWP